MIQTVMNIGRVTRWVRHFDIGAGLKLEVTVRQSERLVRLPLWVGLSLAQQEKVVQVLRESLGY